MIARDRELLARAASVNRSLGAVVVELVHRQDGGELPADGLREVGQALYTLSRDMLARAAELDARIIDTNV